jgi:hypothetical protein
MLRLIRNAAVVSVLVGAVGVGCSSSSGDDSAAAGMSNGGSAGSTSHGGTGGSSVGGSGGSSTGGTSTANGGKSGSGAAGADNTAAGADNSGAGADNSSAGAGGAPDQGPQACNELAFTGQQVVATLSAAAVPTFSNGTPTAGDYGLTSATIYNGGSGPSGMVGSMIHVSIVGSTVTIQGADSKGVTSTTVIVMGEPSSMPPSSVKFTCDTDPTLKASVGVEAKTAFKYEATATTLSIYEVPSKLLLVFTLQT